jgi:hypothetical protein
MSEQSKAEQFTEKELELSRDLARVQYETVLRGAIDRSASVIEFALLGLRGLTIINGGALVGLLTFLGQYDIRVGGGLIWAFGAFVIGLFFAFVATLASYLSQTYFNWNEMGEAQRIGMQALGRDSEELFKDSKKSYENGTTARLWAIAAAVSSLLCFVVGSFMALQVLATPLKQVM